MLCFNTSDLTDDAATSLLDWGLRRAEAEEDNDENLLIIHDPEVAVLFVAEFGRVYEAARTAD